ncbi:MAG TPA: hypothetical protein VGP38_05840 [Rubrobacter sp.]|nr:hypothetical protein [Rubrobacter sp.]
MESKREIRRALEYAGWEVRWSALTGDDSEAVVGGYGPYRLVVRFDADRGPTSVLTYRVGSQGIFTERWRGAERLPAPDEVVQRLSERDAGSPPD